MLGGSWSLWRQLDQAEVARRRAQLATVRARLRMQKRVAQLEDDLARMGLLTMALAHICVDKGVVTTEELKERMREIDLADGVEDGKPAPGATEPGGGAQA
jgi:hypothetical protein